MDVKEEKFDKFDNKKKDAAALLDFTATKLAPTGYGHAGSVSVHFFKKKTGLGVDKVEIIFQSQIGQEGKDEDRHMIQSCKEQLVKYFQKKVQTPNAQKN